MKVVWTIARRELKGLFDHPTGYILLVVFIAVNDFLFFRQAYVMHAASMRPMLDLLPWVFLFFVPAVTMRALAEESRSGTLEVVLAQPINEAELLAGKYLGQVLFLWLALALTLPIPLVLSFGADLEAGVVVAQYAGAALLALGLGGVGLWASSLSGNQITAFIVSVAVMFVLVLVGLDPLLVGLPPALSAIAAQLGVLSHFQNIARGVIDLRDAIYFATLAAIFLSLAYLALMTRKLTPKGERYLRKLEGTDFKISKPKRWDEKYRVVIFDIKEGKKTIREQLRVTLRAIGFIQLQKSVWVYPYDCEDLITLLKADFEIGREVLYMVVDQIEGDEWVRKHFGLA